MGRVFLYQDTLLDRQVAIKFLSSDLLSPQARARFLVEARALARLSHPNVVTLYRVGETREGPYLVSEFVPGRSLAEIDKPLQWGRILSIGLALASGLAAAHRQGIIHRDLKPGNVMLTEDDGVKLLDFGLAQLVDTLTAEQSSARADFLIGTPRYMAPEVRAGQPGTARSDVYALGLILYELCTGHLPWEAGAASMSDGFPLPSPTDAQGMPLATAAPGVDAELAAIVEHCLRHAPAQRYESGAAVLAALQQRAASLPAKVEDAANPYRGLQPFFAEHRALFFGRSTEVREVIDRLRTDHAVLVAGDSGVGKSSLCRAGVLPRVQEGALDEAMNFTIKTLFPGRRPVEALAAVFADAVGMKEAELRELLRRDPGALGRSLREKPHRHAGTLLFIDQAEELLTVSEPQEAALFGQIFADLALPARGIRLLLTVRGDYLTRLSTVPGLADSIQRAFYLLRPLSTAGIREAITRPARRCGSRFESEQLVDELGAAAGGMSGGLPLLQFALSELWELRQREDNIITASALATIGGVEGALARHADGVLQAMPTHQRTHARRLFLRLVGIEHTRVSRPEHELGLSSEDARRALSALVAARLITVSASGETAIYGIAHDALIIGWDTLRGWLATDEEQRIIRDRLERAAAEWERLGRPPEGLWNERQLSEATRLELTALPPIDRGFVEASRRAGKRRSLLRVAAIAALPITVLVIYGGVRWRATAERDRTVASHVAVATRASAVAREHVPTAETAKQRAFAAFDRGEDRDGERAWASAVAAEREIEQGWRSASDHMEAALLIDAGREDVRQKLAEIIYERYVQAERTRSRDAQEQLAGRLAAFDNRGNFTARLLAPAHLQIVTRPAGAEVRIERYEDKDGRRQAGPSRIVGRTPLADLELAPGSWRLTLAAADRPQVYHPVLLARGERFTIDIALPAHIPDGYAYVPPGRFLIGSPDDESIRSTFLNQQPMHELRTAGYLIARHEVTYAEWIEFLRALPATERAQRRPRVDNYHTGAVELSEMDGKWSLMFRIPTLRIDQAYRALDGERIHYIGRDRRVDQDWRRFPVTGVSASDGRMYTAWLARTGRVPGARLCTAVEWERAARGADGRAYPHSDRLQPDDANYDLTYGQRDLAFGPDEVGSHPRSDSPFGISDLSGNAWEWVLDAGGGALYTGGCFYQDQLSARSYLQMGDLRNQPAQRGLFIGLRVCADVIE